MNAAYNYSTDTEGLPKTNFQDMEKIGKHVVGVPEIGQTIRDFALVKDGVKAGTYLFQECYAFMSIVKSADYNVFKQDGTLDREIANMVALLAYVYQARLNVRSEMASFEDRLTLEDLSPESQTDALNVEQGEVQLLITELCGIAKMKDAEYGASWCLRGGIGAWFTTVRKFDRISTQLKQLNHNLWNVETDVDATESLEETLKDAVNYLLLIAEKRSVIHAP